MLYKKGMSAVVEGVLILLIVVGVASVVFLFSKTALQNMTSGGPTLMGDCQNIKMKISATDDKLNINNVGNIIIYGIAVQKITDDSGMELKRFPSAKVYPAQGISITYDLRNLIPAPASGEQTSKIKVIPMILKNPDNEESATECDVQYGVEYDFTN